MKSEVKRITTTDDVTDTLDVNATDNKDTN